MAGEVLLQCQTSRQRLAVAKEGQVVYVLGLVRPAEASQALRFPLNFALVLDRSFSMRGANLQAVKAGVSMLVDALTPGDYLSVVSFKGKADVIVPAQPVQDKQAIKAAVDGMRAWGGTKMSEGLRGGLQELSTYMRPDVVSRMVVLTDGRTSGDEAACREVADQARAWGVGIYPLGLGANWDERLLDELGQRSGGMPAEFVQQPTDMLRIFQEQARSAAAVAVRNTSLTLRMPPGVAARRAVRMLPIVDDLSDGVLGSMKVEVALGDLPRDATQAVLFELLISPRTAGHFRIAQVELTYDVPLLGLMKQSARQDMLVEFVNDPAQAGAVDEMVMAYASRANAYRLVNRAVDEYRRTGRTTVRMANDAAEMLDDLTRAQLDQLRAGQVAPEQASVIMKGINTRTRRMTASIEDGDPLEDSKGKAQRQSKKRAP
ncbi:MAG TPA: VWA domain-containing protein [Ktedonobacterales bacterium]|nr:VWA domain-containing protein [Ktedonobacterales bacterium]